MIKPVEKLKYETPQLIRRERLSTIVAATTSGPID